MFIADTASLGSRRGSSRSSHRQSYESSMSQKLSDVEREIREEERRRRRKKKKKRRQNRVQPILEPISSSLAAIRMRQLQRQQKGRSDSSDHSRASTHGANVAIGKNNLPLQSIVSSNILSESEVTGDSYSISEIELPLVKQKMPDFSMFTVNTALLPIENKEDNSVVTTNLKGANPSPSGSVRRGRRREVKLEMTETSFYQEDEDNIEMGGNQTIHAEENCHEVAEVKANLKDIGPLVNEIFEHARVSSANGKSNRQRDAMGSSRLGSASSKGSRSSRGSQSASKDLKYANTKVNLPPERPRTDLEKTARKRPFSGDYILASRKNAAKREEPTRKSQSQPGSRVSSATASHKRQIGQNGKMDFSDGLSWSRFLQTKGYNAGHLFGPIGIPPSSDKGQMDFLNSPLFQESDKFMPTHYTGQAPFPGPQNSQGPFAGQLHNAGRIETIQEPPTIQPESPNNVLNLEHKSGSPVDILNVEQEHKRLYEIKRPYTNPFRKHRDPTEGDVLGNIPDNENVEDMDRSCDKSDRKDTLNILNVEAERYKYNDRLRPIEGNINVLNVAAEQINDTDSEMGENFDPETNRTVVNVDVVDLEYVKDLDQPHLILHRAKTELDEVEHERTERNTSPVFATSNKVKQNDRDGEVEVVRNKSFKSASPIESPREQKLLGVTRNQGNFLDGHKISSFDGQGLQKTKKVPQAKFLVQDPSKLNGAVVLSKPLLNVDSHQSNIKEYSVSPTRGNTMVIKQNGGSSGKTSKPITMGGKQNVKESSKKKMDKLNSKPPSSDTSAKNIVPTPPRNRLGSDGLGSSGSRSLSAVTRSSGTSRNSGNSQSSSKKSDSGLGALNLGYINDHINKGKEKERSSSKSKVVPERSVGMFDFIDDGENMETDYEDVSTDNLTDTYTYTDCDDDLTEVSSLPC